MQSWCVFFSLQRLITIKFEERMNFCIVTWLIESNADWLTKKFNWQILILWGDSLCCVFLPVVSLTSLSQTWSSLRFSLKVSTGSSWSAEVAARLSPFTPEKAAPSSSCYYYYNNPFPQPCSSISCTLTPPSSLRHHQVTYISAETSLSHPLNSPAQLKHLSTRNRRIKAKPFHCNPL